jgi:hypothetical protein
MNTEAAAVFTTPGPEGLRPAAVFVHIQHALAIGLRSTKAIAETREMQEQSALRHALNAPPIQEIKFTPSSILTEQRNEVAYLEAAVSVTSKLSPYRSLEEVLDALQNIGGDITPESVKNDPVVKARYIVEIALGTREPFAD